MPTRILVLGGTGAMGVYLVPELLRRGYAVDVVSKDDIPSTHPNLRYFVADAKSLDAMAPFLDAGYDAIVDFMIYKTPRFAEWHPRLLASTQHYIYLSSYRVYANEEHPITETSPRLWDIVDTLNNPEYAAFDDYSLYKARGEDMLHASGRTNWTIVRPAITFSSRRFQLVTLEMPNTVARAFVGKKVVLPEAARQVQGTMTWAGDVAQMLAGLLLNPAAYGETYSVCTAEHHSWGEIADIYRDLVGLEAVWVSTDDYIEAIGGKAPNRWQLEYDRLFDRVMDNRKILAAVGLTQDGLSPVRDAIARELAQLPRDIYDPADPINVTMDKWLAAHGM